MNRAFAFALLLLVTAGAPAATAGADDDERVSAQCDDLCTEIAVCYESVYDRDYRGGGACTAACREKPPAARAAFAACVRKNAKRCRAMLRCG